MRLLIAITAALLASAASAQNMPPVDLQAIEREMAANNLLPNTPGSGPYPAVMETDPSLAKHVIYRPANLGALKGRKLAVLVWGNGGCRDDGASARFHLSEIASHGYLVIAPGAIYSGPGALPHAPLQIPTDGKFPPIATTAEDVRAGIDWALAENRRSGSRYRGLIDPAQIAVSGHSCGGLQALQVAADPRIKAVVIHNSGIFNTGAGPITGMVIDKTALNTLHTPIVYILGGPTDIAFANGSDDYARIDRVPAAKLNLPVGHGGTFGQPNGGAAAQVALDWLEWQLRGDMTAARSFTGPNCRLCAGSSWSVERKKIP